MLCAMDYAGIVVGALRSTCTRTSLANAAGLNTLGGFVSKLLFFRLSFSFKAFSLLSLNLSSTNLCICVFAFISRRFALQLIG